jgi:tRNA(fMet)-specific endonuclease VapC
MPTFLLDTNAISDLMGDHPRLSAQVSRRRGLLRTSVIVRGEIRHGIVRMRAGKRRRLLEAKEAQVFASMPCEQITVQIADKYGELKRDQEARRLALDDNDLWIAATALVLGAVVVTRDQDFLRIPGLPVEDWTR